MSFKKINENVEIIQTLPKDPTLEYKELQKKFDEGSRIIKEAFNTQVDKLNNEMIFYEVLEEWED